MSECLLLATVVTSVEVRLELQILQESKLVLIFWSMVELVSRDLAIFLGFSIVWEGLEVFSKEVDCLRSFMLTLLV